MNKQKGVPIHEVYEFAINNLSSYSPMEQSIMCKNIAKLEYIDDLLDKNIDVMEQIFECFIKAIENHTMPVDIFSLSAFVFKGKERGVNVQPLIDTMSRHGAWLKKEQEKNMKPTTLKN